MTTRILAAVLLIALATGGPAGAQFRMPAYSPPGRSASSVVPAMAPPGVDDIPAPKPVANPAARVDNLGSPIPQTATTQPGESVGTLLAPPGAPAGSYGSPWYTDGPGCGGPIGGHGLVAYDVYWMTGPSLPFGSGAFTDRLHLGWEVAGGGRTLFFNPAGDAAWALDLGLSYTYNRGSNDDFLDVFTRTPPLTGLNNQVIAQPDQFRTVRIRALHRTSFNFGVGHDWFLWGNALPGGEEGWNLRAGVDVGGRWGTAHVDMVPFDEPGGYSRRQKVFHGTYIAFHSNCERPFGGWILFAGSRVEWSYDWMDIVPPLKGDVQNINMLLTAGVRF
jgi:hypothetical protein